MPKEVAEQYPELLHYTTAVGLSGIITSGCVWASHAYFLNDAEEITHYFDVRLPSLALEVVEKFANELAKSPQIAEKMLADGGIEKLALAEANLWATRLRHATLAMNQPFIFSMSAPRNAQVAKSGLLSQWRGYGSDGGYALVFDTAGFNELLNLEGTTHQYSHATWGNVHYHGAGEQTQPSTEDVAELEVILRKGIETLVSGGAAEETKRFYEATSSLSCLYKHWGFLEECEVRVVVIPADEELAKQAAAEGETRLLRPSRTYVRSGMPVPYLELFSNLPNRPRLLPIKRVIVGPHRDKQLRVAAVERLLRQNGYDVEVVCSDIPYIGR